MSVDAIDPQALASLARWVAIGAVFGLYAWHSGRDLRLHFRVRKVPLAETGLHVLVGTGVAMLLTSAIRGTLPGALLSSSVIAVSGLLDELGFHGDLPVEEHQAHARGHVCLLALVATCLAAAARPMGVR